MTNGYHEPVLVKEVMEYLEPAVGEQFIDATLGGGGHSSEFLAKGVKLLSIDKDQEAIDFVLSKEENRKIVASGQWTIVKNDFAKIEQIAKEHSFSKVKGVFFDLGVSSHQFDDKKRGFGFESESELDMRLDQTTGLKASVLVNGLTKKELEKLFIKYGEDKNAWRIAREIDRRRKIKPIITCRELAELCVKVCGHIRPHPATQIFQALRIQINDELGSLREGLVGAFNLLASGGKLAVISFHSLEDRIVKDFFTEKKLTNEGTILTLKPQVVTLEEREKNPRSRSAKLRALKKNG